MICKKCNSVMKEVYRFTKGKRMILYKCPVCHYEVSKIGVLKKIFEPAPDYKNKGEN